MDDIQELYSTFQIAERSWIRSLSQTPQNQQRQGSPARLEDCSLHYGEFAFVLAGLKPCILIQLPTPDLTTAYYHSALVPHLIHHPAFKRQAKASGLELRCQLITRNVQSPEMHLQGYVLLWSAGTVQAHPQSKRIQNGINLLCPPNVLESSDMNESSNNGSKTTTISEEDLALMLDIPGRLPGTEVELKRMIEVSYWSQGHCSADKESNEPLLLTAFAAQPDQLPDIQAHFKRYRDAVWDLFRIHLKLHVQSMSDM
ncbi:hypothetical protein BGZ50_004477 [Haplosporangium sp. Z 11]|nr:hypothetical protein BGZ50_004477 [Haplosporangium sp. Z 11]